MRWYKLSCGCSYRLRRIVGRLGTEYACRFHDLQVITEQCVTRKRDPREGSDPLF